MRKIRYVFLVAIITLLLMLMPSLTCAMPQEAIVKDTEPVLDPDPIRGGLRLDVEGGSAFTVTLTNTNLILPVLGVVWEVIIMGENGNAYGYSIITHMLAEESRTVFEMGSTDFQEGTYFFHAGAYYPKLSFSGTPTMGSEAKIGIITVSGSTVTVKAINELPDEYNNKVQTNQVELQTTLN